MTIIILRGIIPRWGIPDAGEGGRVIVPDKDTDTTLPAIPPVDDLRNEGQVRAYFELLERDYPQLIEAMRVMNISYPQYLMALQALCPRSSCATDFTRLTL